MREDLVRELRDSVRAARWGAGASGQGMVWRRVRVAGRVRCRLAVVAGLGLCGEGVRVSFEARAAQTPRETAYSLYWGSLLLDDEMKGKRVGLLNSR